MDRRSFLKGSGGAAISGVTCSVIALPVAANPEMTQVVGVQRTRVGGITVTSLSDGFIPLDPSIIEGVSTEDVMGLLQATGVNPAKLVGDVNAWVIDTGSETYMVDSGTGTAFGPTLGRVPSALQAAGYSADAISKLIVTHLHPDHVGGAFNNSGAVFANAEMFVSAVEHGFWTDETNRDNAPEEAKGSFFLAGKAVEAYKDRLSLHEGEAAIATGITAMPLAGHTPGHTGYMIEDGGESLLIWADTTIVTPVQFARPEAVLPFDIDPDQAAATRKTMLGEMAASGQRIAGSHLPFPGIGYVENDGEAYRYAAAGWQYF